MTAAFWMEWRELRLATAALALLGVLIGFLLKLDDGVAMGMVVAVGLLGMPLGAYQGFLDRRAAEHQFLLHRPMSSSALHGARSIAGALAALIVAVVPLAVMLLVPYRRALPVFGPLLDEATHPQWQDVTAGRVAFAVLLSMAMWAAARLGASARGTAGAVVGGMLLPAALAFALIRVAGSTTVATFLVAAALVVAASATREVLALRSQGRSTS